jgi:uncharacterized membrane protein YqjE
MTQVDPPEGGTDALDDVLPDQPTAEPAPHPARELSVHLLRMLETRMAAAGIAFRGETELFVSRLQLKLLAGAGMFFAVWGGIVLLAVALPEDLRVPVLSGVVAGFALLALIAFLVAKKKISSGQVGSMRWFLDSLRQDLELLSRTLTRQAPQPRAKSSPDRSPPHDVAA